MAHEAALAARKRQQCFDQTFLLLADGEQLLAGVAERGDARVGVAERELEQRAFERERGAQLVGGVRDELPLRVEGRLQAGEQSVEGGAELLELVVRPFERKPAMEVAGGDLARRVRDRAQRAQGSAGDHPAEPDREERHDRQRDRGVDEQLVARRVGLTLRRGAGELRVGDDRVRADRHAERVTARHLHTAYAGALDGNDPLSAGADEEAAGVLVTDEDVGDGEQRGAGAEKEAAVDERQPQPDRARGKARTQPVTGETG